MLRAALPTELHGNHSVLALVALEIDGPLRPAQISERTQLTSGGTTKLLDRLEAQGMVTRVFGQVPGDRRGSMVELTPKGHAAVQRMAGTLHDQAAVPEALKHDIDAHLAYAEEIAAGRG